MKKISLILGLGLVLITIFTSSVSAQGMMGNRTSSPSGIVSDDHTAREEAEGKEIWERLQAKETTCDGLSDADFGALGEYFMGQSFGNTERHSVMNQMMKNMMGEKGEEQMHVTLGKRSSGCDINAPFPSGYGLPMMGWMIGYGGSSDWNNILNGWNGFGFGWIFMIIF